MDKINIKQICVKPTMTVQDIIAVIDKSKSGIALVTDDAGRLLGTITDGDIRRFILAARKLDEPCDRVMCARPATVSVETPRHEIQQILAKRKLRHVPVVDALGRVKSLVTMAEFLGADTRNTIAVIMAGGEGKRLRPITESIPKPMIELGNKPLLESIICNLASHAITSIYLAVNYKRKIIEDYFGDGSGFGVSIHYIREPKKLGTIGALSLLQELPSEPFIVMNGDVVTGINFARLIDYHTQHRAMLTTAASQYNLSVPYGVLDLAGHFVLGVKEKPTHTLFCNAGIYVLEPDVVPMIPHDTRYDITTLIDELVARGFPVSAFPLREYWVDIGKKDDLQKAIDDLKKEDAGAE
jgi:dTDP-glucose pyrophosphorylase